MAETNANAATGSEGSDPGVLVVVPEKDQVTVTLPVGGQGVSEPLHGTEESLFPAFDFGAFPSHLFWGLLAFGLLYFLVNRMVVPQVGGIIEDRRDRVASDLGEASRLSRETDEVIAIYEGELSEARHKAFTMAQERRDAIKKELAQKQSETEQMLAERIANAEAQIVARRDAAMAQVDEIARETAQTIVQQFGAITVAENDVADAVKRAGLQNAAV